MEARLSARDNGTKQNRERGPSGPTDMTAQKKYIYISLPNAKLHSVVIYLNLILLFLDKI